MNAKTTASVKSKPWTIMQPVKGQIRLGLLLSCLSCLCSVLALLALALAVGSLQGAPLLPVTDVHWTTAVAGAALFTALSYLLRRFSFDQTHFAAFRLETLLRTGLTAHLARVPLGQVQQMGSAALAKVVYDDVKELHIYVADSTPLYARAYFLPALTLLLLPALDWKLALAAVVVLTLGMLLVSSVMKDRPETLRRYNEAREKVSAAIVEFVQAMPVVRSFDSGEATFGRYRKALEDYRQMLGGWWRKAGRAAKWSMAVLNPLPTLAVLLWLGAYLLWQQQLAFSTWVAVLLLGTGMAEALLPLHSIGHLVDRAKISSARIEQVLALPILAPPEHSQIPQDASVCFENVSFRYQSEGDAALQNISFYAAPGTVTALTGPSGSGKSTLVQLVARFWDVSEGRILLGNVDVRELSAQVLMQQVSFVFQDSFLFAASIAGNIRLGQPQASIEQVREAARAAQADEFIQALPQGYDSLAGERGTFLSGGQRQRICIARAILQNRPILLLDEATAFADAENEAALIAALSALMRGKTVLLIAHRLPSIQSAGQILVLDKGALLEQGKHADLLAAAGLYAQLWQSYQEAQDWALRKTLV